MITSQLLACLEQSATPTTTESKLEMRLVLIGGLASCLSLGGCAAGMDAMQANKAEAACSGADRTELRDCIRQKRAELQQQEALDDCRARGISPGNAAYRACFTAAMDASSRRHVEAFRSGLVR